MGADDAIAGGEASTLRIGTTDIPVTVRSVNMTSRRACGMRSPGKCTDGVMSRRER